MWLRRISVPLYNRRFQPRFVSSISSRIKDQVVTAKAGNDSICIQPWCSSFSTSTKKQNIYRSPFPKVVVPEIDIFTFVFEDDNNDDNSSSAEAVAIVDAESGRTVFRGELQESATSIGSAMVKRGIGAKDTVALFAGNSIECLSIMLATLGIGAAFTPANPAFNAAELRKQLMMTSAKMVVADGSLYNVAAEALKDPLLANVPLILIDNDDNSESRAEMSISQMLRDTGDAFPSRTRRLDLIDPMNHVSFIPFSSGTTGLPKGVELTHGSFISCLSQLCRKELFGHVDNVLAMFPIFHVAQIALFVLHLHLRNPIVMMRKFDPVIFLETISRYRLHSLPVAPPVLVFLNKHPMVKKYDLSSVRDIVVGAAPLSKELQEETMKLIGRDNVRQMWGMTELSPLATLDPTGSVKPGSAGVPIPNTSLRVVDDTGGDVSGGELGEVLVKGSQIMKGYLNNPAATTATIDSEGWLRSGDVGYIEPDGHLYVVDRVKELIKYKGHQVAPAELEGLLLEHPAVGDAAVIGVPHEVGGEVPRAFVTLKEGRGSTESELQRFVESRVNAISWLRGGVEFVGEIPRTPSGKILRREIKRAFLEKDN